ncbi:flagellar basal-body MS-ring/collar protein FliF [Oleiphilus sp. HI0080]|jgi:flagellar M-ring protein FliF|uniref:flagellar basal-body MS-ring/collar protein FliF n=1 Tax=Oleiphilus sp. HI0080 TaxID=1822255 RepID=UPI000A925767|nr:flagellar basal-body MS-ring/collar protein FliF [Oleiphilus sp. HI0080]
MSEATVPATTSSVVPEAPQSDLMTGVNRLGLFRQIGLMIGLAGSVALGLALVLWLQEPNYQPAMQNIAAQDMDEVTRVLNLNGIDFKIDPKTGVLLVASEQLYQAKIKLAASGISSDQSVGYEILDQDQGLGSSQFMESTRFKRGLEGELGRTISSFRNIRSARVHLAIPKRSVFVRDSRAPSASVLIEVPNLRGVTREQVEAIVNLVAGSVPEMNKSQVTVVDQRGNLLSKNNESQEDARVSREFEYSRKMESVLNNRISSILEPIVGTGRYRSEVSADVDFTEIEEAEELFNPDMAAVRSEQTLDEQKTAGLDGGIPGALANQPPADAQAPEQAGGAQAQGDDANPTSLRKQSTRNYEVDRTVSYTRHQKGRISRITVAVAVDDIRNINPETGEVSFQKWSDAELERLTLLVRNAVGYSAARGDSVNVLNTPFAPQEVEEFIEPKLWEQSWFWEVVWKALAVIVALIVVFAVIRPTFRNLASSGAQAKEASFGGGDMDGGGLDSFDRVEGGGGVAALGSSGEDFMLPGATEGYDKQVNALKGLIAEDPARVAQVVRTWVNHDG